jgi:hypothetical protein
MTFRGQSAESAPKHVSGAAALNSVVAHVGSLVARIPSPTNTPPMNIPLVPETPSKHRAKHAFDLVSSRFELSPRSLANAPLVFREKVHVDEYLNFPEEMEETREVWLKMRIEDVELEQAAKRRKLQHKAEDN